MELEEELSRAEAAMKEEEAYNKELVAWAKERAAAEAKAMAEEEAELFSGELTPQPHLTDAEWRGIKARLDEEEAERMRAAPVIPKPQPAQKAHCQSCFYFKHIKQMQTTTLNLKHQCHMLFIFFGIRMQTTTLTLQPRAAM